MLRDCKNCKHTWQSESSFHCKTCLSSLDRPFFEPAYHEVHVSAFDKQVSGNHYKDKGIQPIVYIHANNLGFCEGNVIKYVTRHKDKNGRADIEKAIHYLELLLEMEYANTAV